VLKSFAQWLEKFLQDEGAAGFVKGLLGLVAFGAVLSTLFGTVAIRTTFVIGAIVLVLLLLVHLTTRVTRLEQVAAIEANGDTQEYITVNAVIRDAEARFCWDQPKWIQKKVDVKWSPTSTRQQKWTAKYDWEWSGPGRRNACR
jgi:hypothetical protein